MPAVIFNMAFDNVWVCGGLLKYMERERKFVQKAYEVRYARLKERLEEEGVYLKEFHKYYDYLNYMANDKKSVGLFTQDIDVCTEEQTSELIATEQHALDNGMVRYRSVCSFDNKFLMENGIMSPMGLIDYKKLRSAVRKSMAAMIDKTQKIDADNVEWAAAIHTNTDNVHIHFQLVEKEKRKKKGAIFKNGDMLELEAIGKFKTTMIKSLTKQEPLRELTRFQREVLLPCAKELFQTPTDKMIALRQRLPENKNLWNYGSKALDDIRPLIDQTVKSIINADEKSFSNYQKFHERLSEIHQQYVEWFGDGSGEVTYYDKEEKGLVTKRGKGTNIPLQMSNNYQNQLRKDLGNALLKHLRSLPDNSFLPGTSKLKNSEISRELDEIPINDSKSGTLSPIFYDLPEPGFDDSQSETLSPIDAADLVDHEDVIEDNDQKLNLFRADFRDEEYIITKALMSKLRKEKDDEKKKSLFDEAMRLYNSSTQKGNIVSALKLARLYKNGHKCVEANEEYGDMIYSCCYSAVETMMKLPKTDSKSKSDFIKDWGTYQLGKMLENGDGVKQDDVAALKMFLSSESNMCRFAAGSMYYRGTEHIQKSYAKALEILKPVDDIPYASMIKGNIYKYGDDAIKPDVNLAMVEYNHALDLFLKIKDEDRSEYDNYNIGKIYYQGLAGKQDIDEAIKYLKEAVEEKNLNAAEMLGRIYLFEAFDENEDEYRAEGVKLMSEAKKREHKNAAYQLGKYYLDNGDIENAVDNLTYASLTDKNANAQYMLGKFYYMQKDIPSAKKYLTLSANQDNSYAEYMLGKIALEEENPDIAEKLFLKSAEHRNDIAMYALGKLYLSQGKNAEAVKWFTLAADEYDNEFAQYALGKYYIDNGIAEKGEKYLLLSAEKEFSPAQYMLGKHYVGIEDTTTGRGYLLLAANNNFAPAEYKLSMLDYKSGNYTASIEHMKRYIKLNENGDNSIALHMMGKAYIKLKNYNNASACLSQAIANGCKDARYTLGKLYTQHDYFHPDLALPLLKQSADEDNNPYAQMTLGMLYYRYYRNPELGKYYIDKAYANGLGQDRQKNKQYKARRFRPRSPIVNASALAIARRMRITAEIQTQKLINEFEAEFQENVARRRWENEHNQTLSI